MTVDTFWVAPTGTVRLYLRRVCWKAQAPCPANPGLGHQGVTAFEERDVVWGRWTEDGKLRKAKADDRERVLVTGHLARVNLGHPRWPERCDACGIVLPDFASPFIEQRELYAGRGETYELCDLPAGATYDAWWLPAVHRGDDGLAVTVVCPDRTHWHLDALAPDCERQDVPHRCWCRHGDPRTEALTVDKDCESTCAATATTGTWRGRLESGRLVSA